MIVTFVGIPVHEIAKLAPEQRELINFVGSFSRDTLCIYTGFALASAIRGETDFWKVLAEFRAKYSTFTVATGGGHA